MLAPQFIYWLSRQKDVHMLHTQCNALSNIMERAPSGDLIGILYYGRDELALKALHELKRRFHDEMSALDKMSQDQEIL